MRGAPPSRRELGNGAGTGAGVGAGAQVWADLGRSMRLMREDAELSLRRIELACGVGRGTLSQIENAKARPSRDLVEWYDGELGGDGLLIALYAEARGARGPAATTRPDVRGAEPGDCVEVRDPLLAHGELVTPGSQVTAGWTLRNHGTVAWRERRVLRVGAHVAAGLIASEPWVSLPDCDPGDEVRVRVTMTTPEVPGTYAAYWNQADSAGHPIPTLGGLLSAVLVGAHG